MADDNAAASPTPPSGPDPRVAKLDKQIADLRAHDRELRSGRLRFSILSLVVLAASPIAVRVDGLVAFGIASLAVCMLGVSLYLSYIYIRDTAGKIHVARRELAKLKAAAPKA